MCVTLGPLRGWLLHARLSVLRVAFCLVFLLWGGGTKQCCNAATPQHPGFPAALGSVLRGLLSKCRPEVETHPESGHSGYLRDQPVSLLQDWSFLAVARTVQTVKPTVCQRALPGPAREKENKKVQRAHCPNLACCRCRRSLSVPREVEFSTCFGSRALACAPLHQQREECRVLKLHRP